MLGGAGDDVVPRSQMQELWEIIRSRGRDSAERGKKQPLSPSNSGGAAASEEKAQGEEEDKDKEGEDRSEPGDPKGPPRVLTEGGNKYIEFGAGTHSECFCPLLASLRLNVRADLLLLLLLLDDTCVQPGYWSAVAEFVAGLRPKVVPQPSP